MPNAVGISMDGGSYLSITPLDVHGLVLAQDGDVITCDFWVSYCVIVCGGPVLVEAITGVRGGVGHSCPLRA